MVAMEGIVGARVGADPIRAALTARPSREGQLTDARTGGQIRQTARPRREEAVGGTGGAAAITRAEGHRTLRARLPLRQAPMLGKDGRWLRDERINEGQRAIDARCDMQGFSCSVVRASCPGSARTLLMANAAHVSSLFTCCAAGWT